MVALTVDADADANRPAPGRAEAVSPGGEPRFSACARGLRDVADVASELRLPCTIFWTGRCLQAVAEIDPELVRALGAMPDVEHACHGLAHEDFSGHRSGMALDAGQTLGRLAEATDIVAGAFGARPVGFRAPYCRLTPHLERALRRLRYRYDASLTRSPDDGWALLPYALEPAQPGEPPLYELALCRSRDAAGRPITGYLWQLFEGRRGPQDYVEMVARLRGRFPGGLMQIAIHPWHLHVSADGGPLPVRSGRDAAADFHAVLSAVAALDGIRLVTLTGCLERFPAAAWPRLETGSGGPAPVS
jgi:peptidoglycan/xylan/chitin deacetylase (PgdA/CDA1 family)